VDLTDVDDVDMVVDVVVDVVEVVVVVVVAEDVDLVDVDDVDNVDVVVDVVVDMVEVVIVDKEVVALEVVDVDVDVGLFRITGSTELKVNPKSDCVEAELPFIAAFNELTLKPWVFESNVSFESTFVDPA
jgi:hypothetical protein